MTTTHSFRILNVRHVLLALLLTGSVCAEQGGGAPAVGGANSPLLSVLGINNANVDPSNELASWNGQNWNISNNRLFESQFEEYLSTPEESATKILAYEKTLSGIRNLLAPTQVNQANISDAYRRLTIAADFQIDGGICKVIASQVYMAWLAEKNLINMQQSTQSLEAERKRLEWNLQMASRNSGLQSTGGINSANNASARQSVQTAEVQPIATRLVEVETLLKKNDVNKQYTREQARLDFQVLITQLFLQRRFQHVQIAVDFYRTVFNEGAGQVRLGDEAMSLFSKTTGGSPTLATLESLANEAIQKVGTGLRSFEVLLANRQIQSASKRLGETFMIGQMLPSMQLVPMESKQQVLAFVQKTKRLISAIEVKDYAAAEVIIADLKVSATDFDVTKPDAAVQTSKLGAEMHLAKARNAAVAGDKAGLERELQAAAEIWPANPQLKELSARIFVQADVGAQAIADYDRLMSQKNYRQIYDDKLRFIAAVAMQPDKQESLKKVLDNMTEIEITMQQAAEIAKRGDNAGAWEALEIMSRKYPHDTKLNQFRADQTLKAASFVNLIKNAEQYEKDGQPACAMTSYLEAQRLYPPSSFARDGIVRIAKQILPDSQ